MNQELQQAAKRQLTAAQNLPNLSTVGNLPQLYPNLKLTPAAIRAQLFNSEDRQDAKGRKIHGNGLAESGAIIRHGRKILIDVERYGKWLAKGNAGGVK